MGSAQTSEIPAVLSASPISTFLALLCPVCHAAELVAFGIWGIGDAIECGGCGCFGAPFLIDTELANGIRETDSRHCDVTKTFESSMKSASLQLKESIFPRTCHLNVQR